MQETFLAALESFSSFKNKSSFKTWLTSILRNKIFDYYKIENRTIPISSFADDNEENTFLEKYFQGNQDSHPMHWNENSFPSKWNQSPLQAMEIDEFYYVLKNCLDNLPVKHSSIFVMREIDGLSTKEICKELDITESNIWVILHRVRTSLRNCLEHNWFEK